MLRREVFIPANIAMDLEPGIHMEILRVRWIEPFRAADAFIGAPASAGNIVDS